MHVSAVEKHWPKEYYLGDGRRGPSVSTFFYKVLRKFGCGVAGHRFVTSTRGEQQSTEHFAAFAKYMSGAGARSQSVEVVRQAHFGDIKRLSGHGFQGKAKKAHKEATQASLRKLMHSTCTPAL